MILKYKGIDVYYTDNGQGQSIVFLHGFLENSSIWFPFISHLSKKNRVICIDLLGHGKTGCLGYIHTMEDMADGINAVLSHLKIENSIVISHSMGGYVALAFAEKKPDIVKGIVLTNSTSLADSPERKKNRDRAIAVVKHDHKTFIRIAIANLFNPENKIRLSKEIEQLTQEALKTPLQGIIAAIEGMKIRKRREFVLSAFTFKKMMFISKKDPVLDYKSILEEAKNTNTEVVEFPDGHMSLIENERLFLCYIMHFIEK